MIEWEIKYSTGVPELDRQHRNLFKYTNDLGEYLDNNFGSQETTDQMMRFLDQYIKVHFSREETCMNQHHCPAATKNKEAHQKFIDIFRKTEGKIKIEGTDDRALRELHHFLEEWLKEHICKIDAQLKVCIH